MQQMLSSLQLQESLLCQIVHSHLIWAVLRLEKNCFENKSGASYKTAPLRSRGVLLCYECAPRPASAAFGLLCVCLLASQVQFHFLQARLLDKRWWAFLWR